MTSRPLNQPITKSKLENLGSFLKKYDLPDLLIIHGFLAATVSGPNMIMPSEWMDFLGLNKGEYESMDEAQEIINCIMAIYNDIAHQFQDQTFQAIKSSFINKDHADTSAAKNLWAKGYMLGVGYGVEIELQRNVAKKHKSGQVK